MPPKRPPTVKRPPPPTKRPHVDPEASVGEEKPIDKEAQESKQVIEKEVVKETPAHPPKRPPATKRPPPPTVRPVPRQKSTTKSLESPGEGEGAVSPPPGDEPQTPPTSRVEEKMEVDESAVESRPTPAKRHPSVTRPPPPSKRPHHAEDDGRQAVAQKAVSEASTSAPPKRPPVTAMRRPPPPGKKVDNSPTAAANADKLDKPVEPPVPKVASSGDTAEDKLGIEQGVLPQSSTAEVDKERSDVLVEQVADTKSESEVKPNQENVPDASPKHSPGPGRPQPPAVGKDTMADSEAGVVKEEKSQPALPPSSTKKSSIKRPPPPAMPKSKPVRPVSQEIKLAENDKVEVSDSKEQTAVERVAVDKTDSSTDQKVSGHKHCPGPKRPAPPTNKRPSVKSPPTPHEPKQVEDETVKEELASADPTDNVGLDEKSTEQTLPSEAEPTVAKEEEKEQEVSAKTLPHHSPGLKRPAPPTNKRRSVKSAPIKSTPHETKEVETETTKQELTSEKSDGIDEKSTESEQQTPPSEAESKVAVEDKEHEVSARKAPHHSPGPKRPAPPTAKKLSIRKPPPPAAARKPSVKTKPPPPAVAKKEEEEKSEDGVKGDVLGESLESTEQVKQQQGDEMKASHPVVIEPVEGNQEIVQSINGEPSDKLKMTVLVQPGRRSPNSSRKSPTLRKKSKHEDQDSDDELEGSVKIITYPSGSSLTKNGNGVRTTREDSGE